MLQPLHLIERIVRESLVKPRHPGNLLHHHIPSSHSLLHYSHGSCVSPKKQINGVSGTV